MIDLANLPLGVYAAIGTAILWAKLRNNQRRVFGLTDMIEVVIPPGWERTRAAVEILIYLLIGSTVAIAVISPATPAQAFAAGLGWTGLTTSNK